MSPTGKGDRLERLLDDAEQALDQGAPEAALSLCAQALELEPGHPGAWFVRGDATRALGALEEAADSYRRAALARPSHASSWASYGLVSFELLQLEEAQRGASRAIREEPRNPEGWWVHSLLAEWRGDLPGAERALLHARFLDPVGYPIPARLTDDEVESLVEEALTELHPDIRSYLANVAILLEELPDEETLRVYDPPASPLELLGFFSGHSLMERSSEDPWSNLPPTIVLFRRNLERHAGSRDELVHELQITLFHEIGHFLGLSEEDLEARGLD
ncbi:MAG: metallopeptidase family protein [Myxococcota bacterium]|nr:metallopeptidase family protein [Myxococcota bacterium]